MPIHDWGRVRANQFHDFHQTWTVAISNTLNGGRLPAGYFSLLGVSFLSMGKRNGVNAHLSDAEAIRYSRRANSVAIRRADDNVVAVIEIVSPGNKSSRDALRAFTRKAAQLLHAGVHLLIVDLFPPSKRDPQGIHKAIWDRLEEAPFTLPPDKPLTVASYSAGAVKEAYVDPVAVGDPLPDMPIFLTPTHYILCPLESTYQATWDVFPAVLKGPLEAP